MAQRLQRIEHVEYERQLYRWAERIAEKYDKPVDDALHLLYEIERRIARCGIEGEQRRLAQEYGLTIEEVERRYREVVAEWQAGDPSLWPDSAE
jgi:hypothetical protein